MDDLLTEEQLNILTSFRAVTSVPLSLVDQRIKERGTHKDLLAALRSEGTHFLDHGIYWGGTEEGHFFWSDINNAMRSYYLRNYV